MASALRSHLFRKIQSHIPIFISPSFVKTPRRLYFKPNKSPLGIREGPQPSRFHPGHAIDKAEESISSLLSSQPSSHDVQWDELKQDIMLDHYVLSEDNFCGVMLNCMSKNNDVAMAQSFLDFLESRGEPHFLVYLKFMSICGRNVQVCGEEPILRAFRKVKPSLDKLPVLDIKRLELVVEGLCATKEWNRAFDYLKKFQGNPTLLVKNCFAAGAIRNGDESMLWEILTKWFEGKEAPSNRVICEMMRFAVRMVSDDRRRSECFVDCLFDYVRKKEFVMDVKAIKLVEEYFKKHSQKWRISYTKVTRLGVCEGCQKSLKLTHMSVSEFSRLRDSFLERSVKKSDIFINTTKTEFDRYISFVNERKPFHIILDGLNVAYSCPGVKNKRNLAVQLLKIVKSLSIRSRKILVLGKHHMKFWPFAVMKALSQRADVFLTSDTSQDDPFMVYAALASGPHAHILSGDLMRDHVSRLDSLELIGLFKKWQLSHQIFLNVEDDDKISFTEPVKHNINIEGDMQSGWHIPYDNNIMLDAYEELNNWLCIENTLLL